MSPVSPVPCSCVPYLTCPCLFPQMTPRVVPLSPVSPVPCPCMSPQVGPEDGPRLAEFLALQSFVRGQYGDEASFRALDAHLRGLPGGDCAHRLFYLALPPSVYTPVTQNLRALCMGQG